MNTKGLQEFAARYTAAWSSHDAAGVASFFEADGSLKINDGEPSLGREAIAAAAQGFMTTFPDFVLEMDSLRIEAGIVEYHWTFTGTNTGPAAPETPSGSAATRNGRYVRTAWLQRQRDTSTKLSTVANLNLASEVRDRWFWSGMSESAA